MEKIHDMFSIEKCVSSLEKNHEGKNDTLIKIQYNSKSMHFSDGSIKDKIPLNRSFNWY